MQRIVVYAAEEPMQPRRATLVGESGRVSTHQESDKDAVALNATHQTAMMRCASVTPCGSLLPSCGSVPFVAASSSPDRAPSEVSTVATGTALEERDASLEEMEAEAAETAVMMLSGSIGGSRSVGVAPKRMLGLAMNMTPIKLKMPAIVSPHVNGSPRKR